MKGVIRSDEGMLINPTLHPLSCRILSLCGGRITAIEPGLL